MATNPNRKVEDAEDKNNDGKPDEYEETEKKNVSETQISQAQAMDNTANQSGQTVERNEADSPDSDEVQEKATVKARVIARSYTRHDFYTKKTKNYMHGQEVLVTQPELDKLSIGDWPALEAVDKDD